MLRIFPLFVLFLSLLLPFNIFGLEEAGVKELDCGSVSPPGDDVSVDADWMSSVKAFHIPIWSKLYAYRTAAELLEKDVSDISTEELDTACLRFSNGNIVSGFGHTKPYNISGDGKSLTFRAPWVGAQKGHFVFHLTDNQNYVLGITCWDDQESGWALLTTTDSVDPGVKEEILKYVTSLGFNGALAHDSTSSYAKCPSTTAQDGAGVGTQSDGDDVIEIQSAGQPIVQDVTQVEAGSPNDVIELTPAKDTAAAIPTNYVWYYPNHYSYILQPQVAAQPYYYPYTYSNPGQFAQLPLGYH